MTYGLEALKKWVKECDDKGFVIDSQRHNIIKELLNELAKEREARVKYQSVVYDCCNRLDAAFSRSVRGGEGTTIDQVAPDISFLNRLRLEAIAKAEAAEAQVERLKEENEYYKTGSHYRAWQKEKKYQAVVSISQQIIDFEKLNNPTILSVEFGKFLGDLKYAVRQLKED